MYIMRCILYLIVYYIYSRHRGGWKGSIDEVTMGPAQHRRCGPSYWQFGAGKRYKSPSHLAVIRWTVQGIRNSETYGNPNTICSKECSWYMRIARIVLANYIDVESTKKRQIGLIRCALTKKHGKKICQSIYEVCSEFWMTLVSLIIHGCDPTRI